MPGRKRGNGSVADITVEILRDIRNEIRETNQRLGRVEVRLEHVEERLENVGRGVAQLTARFDHFLEFAAAGS